MLLHFPELHAGCCSSRHGDKHEEVQGVPAISPPTNIVHGSPQRLRHEAKAVASSSTSHDVLDENKCCPCKRASIDQMLSEDTFAGITLKFKSNDMHIGDGGYGHVEYAYWESEDRKCVALKVSQLFDEKKILRIRNEVEVLQHINYLPPKERDHIITMYGNEERWNTRSGINMMYILLEIGGLNLEEYYKKIKTRKSELLYILKCAARAIQQFHTNIGIHMDIKASNFVIPFDHNLNYSLTSCKLIDFNFSIITNNEQEEVDELFGTNIYVPPEFLTTKIATRKNDIYAFGVMTYKFLFNPKSKDNEFNINKNNLGSDRLHRVARACMEE